MCGGLGDIVKFLIIMKLNLRLVNNNMKLNQLQCVVLLGDPIYARIDCSIRALVAMHYSSSALHPGPVAWVRAS